MRRTHQELEKLRRRLRFFRGLDHAWWGLAAGFSAATLLVVFERLDLTGSVSLLTLGAVIFGSTAAGVVSGYLRRFSLFEAALRADASLKLSERLSSAVLLDQENLRDQPAVVALLNDAERHAQALRIREDFRYRAPHHARYAFVPAILLIGSFFLPEYPLFPEKSAVAQQATTPILTEEQRQDEAETIRQIAQETREALIESQLDQLELAERLERIADDLSQGRLTENDAAAEMSTIRDELRMEERSLQRELQPFREIQGLRQSRETHGIQRALRDQDFAQATDQIRDLVERVRENLESMTAEELQSLAKDLSQLAEQTANGSPQLSEALQQLAAAMQECAACQGSKQDGEGDQASSSGNPSSAPDPEALRQALANALQQNEQALDDLQQLRNQIERLSNLQNQLAQSQQRCMTGKCSGYGEGAAELATGTGDEEKGGASAGIQPIDGQAGGSEAVAVAMSGDSGGEGQGGGEVPDSGVRAVGFIDDFIPGQMNEGEIIAIITTDNPLPGGEPAVRLQGVPAEFRQRAADSITRQDLPAGLRGPVRDYFEAINFGREPSSSESKNP